MNIDMYNRLDRFSFETSLKVFLILYKFFSLLISFITRLNMGKKVICRGFGW